MAGEKKAFTAAIYRYHLLEQDFGLFTSSVFVGGSLEYGGVFNESLPINELPLYRAGSLFGGITTPIGPLLLAYGRTEKANNSFYVSFGSAF